MAVEKNNIILQRLLEDAASDKNSYKESVARKIGYFYISGMNEEKIEREGIKPLQKESGNIEIP